jgi:mannobiose 2-epimerase
MENDVLREMREAVRLELFDDILPFWMTRTPDEKHGGFYGRISNDLIVDEHAPKSLVVTARILWTFSAVQRYKPDPGTLKIANRAYDFLLHRFWDLIYSGAHWMLDHEGRPIDRKKKIYGQAFLIYALTEYHRATGNPLAKEKAIQLFQLVEEFAYDRVNTGYFEAYERNWKLADDLRLSDKDLNEAKSMNTHLHLMEAYANLYRVWKDPLLQKRLEQLILNFRDRIIDRNADRLICFFTETWEPRSDLVSFGHDIEASWLLCESAGILGDPSLEKEIRAIALRMAEAVHGRGRDGDGSILYEADSTGIIDSDKHFWVEAEGVVGFLNAFQLSGDEKYLEDSRLCWEFIQKHLIDKKFGDWFYRTDRQGAPRMDVPKVSEWKCPYHSSRMCLETLDRLGKIIEGAPS